MAIAFHDNPARPDGASNARSNVRKNGELPPETVKALADLATMGFERREGPGQWRFAAKVLATTLAATGLMWAMMQDIVTRGIAPVEVRVSALEKRTERLEEGVMANTARLIALEHRLDGMSKRMEGVEGRLKAVEGQLGAVVDYLGRMDAKLDRMARK